jgi:hypothetical protein
MFQEGGLYAPYKITALTYRLPYVSQDEKYSEQYINLQVQQSGTEFSRQFYDDTIIDFSHLQRLIQQYPKEYASTKLQGNWYICWLINKNEINEAIKILSSQQIPADEKVLVYALLSINEELVLMVLDHMNDPVVNNFDIIHWACSYYSQLVISRLIQRGYNADSLCYQYIFSRTDIQFHTKRSMCEIMYIFHKIPLGDKWYIETFKYSHNVRCFLWDWGKARGIPMTGITVDACIPYNNSEILHSLAKYKFTLNQCAWILFDIEPEKRLKIAETITLYWGSMPPGSLDMAVLVSDLELAKYLRQFDHHLIKPHLVLKSFMKIHKKIPAKITLDARIKIIEWAIIELCDELLENSSSIPEELFNKESYDVSLKNNYLILENNFLSNAKLHKQYNLKNIYTFGESYQVADLSNKSIKPIKLKTVFTIGKKEPIIQGAKQLINNEVNHNQLPLIDKEEVNHNQLPLIDKEEVNHNKLPLMNNEEVNHNQLPLIDKEEVNHNQLPLIDNNEVNHNQVQLMGNEANHNQLPLMDNDSQLSMDSEVNYNQLQLMDNNAYCNSSYEKSDMNNFSPKRRFKRQRENSNPIVLNSPIKNDAMFQVSPDE